VQPETSPVPATIPDLVSDWYGLAWIAASATPE
jgi:hypothetical protein